jgi:hypothetical protein
MAFYQFLMAAKSWVGKGKDVYPIVRLAVDEYLSGNISESNIDTWLKKLEQ